MFCNNKKDSNYDSINPYGAPGMSYAALDTAYTVNNPSNVGLKMSPKSTKQSDNAFSNSWTSVGQPTHQPTLVKDADQLWHSAQDTSYKATGFSVLKLLLIIILLIILVYCIYWLFTDSAHKKDVYYVRSV